MEGLVLVEIPALWPLGAYVNSRLEFYREGKKIWEQSLDPMPLEMFLELQESLSKSPKS